MCCGGSVGNEKEAIRGGLDGSIKRSSNNQRIRNSINDNQTAESNLQKDFLDKEMSETMSCNIVSRIDNDKASEITHNIHEVGITTVIHNFAGLPKIDIKDVEKGQQRSQEKISSLL